MKERRSSKRVIVNHLVPITVDDVALDTTLVDISKDGALFTVNGDDAKKIGDPDLGREVTFRIKPKNSPIRLYNGEIIRLYYYNDVLHIALRFWQKYSELA